MIIYLSAFEPKRYYELGLRNNISSYLYSFFTVKGETLIERYNSKYNIFIDSGGYSARVKGVTISVEDYAKFLIKAKGYYTVAANLDTNDVEETLKNQEYLIKNTPAKILPIYHMSDWLSSKHKHLLDDFIKDFDYIGVGGMAGVAAKKQRQRKFLDYVFSKTKDKVKVHGFGITDRKFLKRYPFYSVDSTSWNAGSLYGQCWSEDGKSFSYRDKTKMLKDNRSLGSVDNYLERSNKDLKYWSNLEKEMTRLWEKRGIIWS